MGGSLFCTPCFSIRPSASAECLGSQCGYGKVGLAKTSVKRRVITREHEVKLLTNVSCADWMQRHVAAAECLGAQCGFGEVGLAKTSVKRRTITRE